MKRVLAALLILFAASALAFAAFVYIGPGSSEPITNPGQNTATTSASIRSFDDCVTAGYPVTEASPRGCRTPDGRTFAEEIRIEPTYVNASPDLIQVTLPTPGSVTGKSFKVIGEARGYWYFEASFSIDVLDANGLILASVPAEAQSDWMTESFVPFSADITIPSTYTGPATLVLRNANASGLPERDASISIPITIEY